MTSSRPYLIRAMHQWISDNGMTPYLLVDAGTPGVKVPPQAVKDGKLVLNIAARAVAQLELGNDWIHFMARFGGVAQAIELPIAAVRAIYAQESGQGMQLPPEDAPPPSAPTPPAAGGDNKSDKRAKLRVVK